MNKQEAFDTVVKHLYSMKGQSLGLIDGEKACAYRGGDGARCAIGCLIPDELYEAGMEGLSARRLLQQFAGVKELFDGVDSEFLLDLQLIHDTDRNWDENGFRRHDPKVVEWLRHIARSYCLVYKE